ncbi:hypothetical protein [Caldalkalibacillus salinus]|uniref:hypothetical protein n=1 Tax=Caldalkalibacillus salinus TaxID=2803787 RepID=UPI0019212DB0|nr:hypothetical protein [Caldalkalibacillus salinus]
MARVKMMLLTMIMTLILVGCSNDSSTSVFISELEETNLEFTVIDNDEKSEFFSIPPTVIDVDGEYILIYEYENKEEMEKEASSIHDNGNIGSALIVYVSSPHFYKKENIIVQYVGENEEIMNGVEQIMGEQFAGQTF